MEQVEVFRGPQSHIQGQNAIAGAVVMTSKDPTHDWEGALRLGAGNQKARLASAAVSGPIVKDKLAFRFAIDRAQRESFVDLIPYEPAGNPRRVESTTARLKFLYTPTDNPDLFSRFTVNHIDARAPQNETLNNPESTRYSPQRPVFETGSTSAVWDVSVPLGGDFLFTNRIVYSDYYNDRLSLPMPQGVPATLDGREWQWQPMIRFEGGDAPFKGLAGLHVFASKQHETVDVLRQHNTFADKNRVLAAFAEGTWFAGPQWEITAGARIERESHRRTGGSSVLSLDLDKSQTVFLPKIDIAYKPTENLTTGIKAARGYNPGGAGITFGTPVVSYTYEPEYVNNYELYARYRPNTQWLLAANAFYNDYKNMQLPFYLGPNSVVIRNADKVNTYGAEVEAHWQPDDKLDLHASLGLLKTRIKRYPQSGIEGNALGRAPAYTANLGASYRLDSGWKLGGDLRMVGSYHSQASNAEVGKIGAYRQLNLHAGYAFKNGEITLYADNVLNSDSPVFIPLADRREALIQRPRSVGVNLTYHFK